MKDLVARINIRSKLEAAPIEERNNMGLYCRMTGNEAELYRNKDFQKMVNYIIAKGTESELNTEQKLAKEVKDTLEQDSEDTPLEIRVVESTDAQVTYFRNVNDVERQTVDLGDAIKPYLKETQIDPGDGTIKEFDYLDFVVENNTKIGSKKY